MKTYEMIYLSVLLEKALDDERLYARPVPAHAGKRAGTDLLRALDAVRAVLASTEATREA